MATNKDRFRKGFLLLFVVLVSIAFLWMLQPFLMTILLAAIFSGLVYPVYARLVVAFGGRRQAASGVTILGVVVLVVLPLLGTFGLVINQAIAVTENIRPVVERLINEPTYLEQQMQRVPGLARIEPYRDQILTRAGDVVNTIGAFLIGSLSETTRMTVAFVFHFVILLYSMFFLLIDGPHMLTAILGHLPLRPDDKDQIKQRFVSVTRATVKGTIVIGIIQGVMSGLSFWVVGIPNVTFWSIVMVVLAIIPMIGGALVWLPAAIWLMATGHVWQGLALAAFNALVVGSVDNLLRPRLVGHDTKMHDLVILFSTLAGILFFGPLGFIIGPILAGVFVTSWEIFGATYHEVLEEDPSLIMLASEPARRSSEPIVPGVEIP